MAENLIGSHWRLVIGAGVEDWILDLRVWELLRLEFDGPENAVALVLHGHGPEPGHGYGHGLGWWLMELVFGYHLLGFVLHRIFIIVLKVHKSVLEHRL